MKDCRIIVIGGATGGVEALRDLLDGADDFACPILAAIDPAPNGQIKLPSAFGRRSSIPVSFAVDGGKIEGGQVYIAPRDEIMIITDGQISLLRESNGGRTRSVINPLFNSAAREYGERAIGVILSGALLNGSAGLIAIKNAGGICIVQDPKDASFQSIVHNAVLNDHVDYVANATDIGRLLIALCQNKLSSN